MLARQLPDSESSSKAKASESSDKGLRTTQVGCALLWLAAFSFMIFPGQVESLGVGRFYLRGGMAVVGVVMLAMGIVRYSRGRRQGNSVESSELAS